jgi:hypothetical protein
MNDMHMLGMVWKLCALQLVLPEHQTARCVAVSYFQLLYCADTLM